MSLKAVHIFFIVASLVLALFLGNWAVRDYMSSSERASLALAFGSFVAGLFLLAYLVWFIQKIKRLRR